MMISTQQPKQKTFTLLQPLKHWLDNWEIEQQQTARRIVKLIPAQCPFAREIRIRERVIFKVPPLCKLNPVYEQLIGLRFRALCFLAARCGEDITSYCS